jgi:hypothetical protein
MNKTPSRGALSRPLKLLLALLLVGGLAIVARASLQPNAYLPYIAQLDFTATPSLTPTVTVTGTITITPTATVTGTLPTPTQTRTPTPTSTLVPGVFIVDIEYAPETDPLDEYVIIRNQTGNFIPLDGWTLRDDSNTTINIFTFPRYTLVPWASVKVWTKAGRIDPENIYWGRTEPVWNDHGDCAYLRDDDGILMDSECYGLTGSSISIFQNLP